MKLSQMDYFLEVAERLNFTSAAKALYVSQPALSKQIALLEEELGARLFIRNSRSVMLTEAGKQLKQDLKAVREELNRAIQRAGAIGRSQPRVVRVGCFDGKVNQDFLPEVYRQIHKADPNINIVLQMGGFEENRRALERGEIDVMLTLDKGISIESTDRVCRIVKRSGALVFDKSLFAPEEREHLTPGHFRDLPLLLVKREQSPDMYEGTLRDLRAIGIEHPTIVEAENSMTLFTYLEMGCGYGVLSQNLAQAYPNLGMLPLDGPSPETWVLAIWKKGRPMAEILMEHFTTDQNLEDAGQTDRSCAGYG